MEYCVPLPPWFGNTEPTFANTEETEMSLRPQINCHTISGTVASGRFGPELTHLMSRETLAAGAATNTHEKLRAWIQGLGFHQARFADASNESDRLNFHH
jgi:hypothetical protein